MKEKVPLAILEALNPASNENLQYVSAHDVQGAILLLRDKSTTSDFYFKINRTENRTNGLYFLVEYKPKAKEDTANAIHWLTLENVISALNAWLTFVGAYQTTKSILDDPITRSYEDQFSKRFDIIDEDAAYTGFDLEQQLYIDEYLNGVRSKVQSLKEGRTEAEITQLNEIEAEASEIQKNLTKESKRNIVHRLARMWAKAQRVGLDVIKEIFVSVLSDLTKKLLTGS